jgi:hypothetical protein
MGPATPGKLRREERAVLLLVIEKLAQFKPQIGLAPPQASNCAR